MMRADSAPSEIGSEASENTHEQLRHDLAADAQREERADVKFATRSDAANGRCPPQQPSPPRACCV